MDPNRISPKSRTSQGIFFKILEKLSKIPNQPRYHILNSNTYPKHTDISNIFRVFGVQNRVNRYTAQYSFISITRRISVSQYGLPKIST